MGSTHDVDPSLTSRAAATRVWVAHRRTTGAGAARPVALVDPDRRPGGDHRGLGSLRIPVHLAVRAHGRLLPGDHEADRRLGRRPPPRPPGLSAPSPARRTVSLPTPQGGGNLLYL